MTTQIHSAMLLSDWLVWVLFFCIIALVFWARKQPHLVEPWRQVIRSRLGMMALVVLIFYMGVGLLDSIHLEIDRVSSTGQQLSVQTKSLFDIIISPLGQQEEKTYSAPFSAHSFSRSLTTLPSGKEIRTYPRLKYGGAKLKQPETDRIYDITLRILRGLAIGTVSFAIIALLWLFLLAKIYKTRLRTITYQVFTGKTVVVWREAMLMAFIIWLFIAACSQLAAAYHIFGTDKIGNDVFYQAIKSIRTGLLIGTLTTLFMLPFALILGTFAGYFGGWVDDIIQYLYTTLSSIPGVLLISATILVLQIFISNHTHLFPTLAQRADARLLALCLILGITSWASLCRLLRGETLKLRDQEFILAAKSLGVKQFTIIFRHVMPNVMHIVLITLVLDFSGLVLAEAVLSYVGVGVDPTTISWGNMINSSRLELAREPIVWWPLLAALVFMFVLVLCANLFADKVRDAFDPRLRHVDQ